MSRAMDKLTAKESTYGKVYKVAGPCKYKSFPSFDVYIFSPKLVVVAEQMAGAKMYELVRLKIPKYMHHKFLIFSR